MKKLHKILSVSFVALLSVPFISSFFNNSKKVTSEDKISFPKMSTEFFDDLSSYLEQEFYFRPDIIETNKKLDNLLLDAEKDMIYNQMSDIFGEDYLEPISINNALYGRNDWLFYTGDDSVGYYRGTNLPSNQELEQQANSLLSLKEACDKKGINLVVLACPNKEQIYSEFMPSYSIKSETKRLSIIKDYMVNKGINYLYPIEELLEEKVNGDVYYKQDTHWNLRGGYIGYKKFMNSIGKAVSKVVFSEYEKVGGDLSNMCGFASPYIDYNMTYKPEVNPNYLIATDTLYTMNEGSVNGKLYVVSDSFRGALQPYAIKDFNEVLSLHRMSMLSDTSINYVKSLGEGDTLLVQFVERYDSCVNDVSKNLLDILSNQ